jgi:hypothetical protein
MEMSRELEIFGSRNNTREKKLPTKETRLHKILSMYTNTMQEYIILFLFYLLFSRRILFTLFLESNFIYSWIGLEWPADTEPVRTRPIMTVYFLPSPKAEKSRGGMLTVGLGWCPCGTISSLTRRNQHHRSWLFGISNHLSAVFFSPVGRMFFGWFVCMPSLLGHPVQVL